MAWGKPKSQPPPRSTITQLLPLIITLAILSVVGWVCYQIYVSLIKIKAQAEKQMGEKNVVFTKDGLRVNMKDVRTESYLDATQSWFVKAWDLSGNAIDTSKRKRNVLTKQRSPEMSS
ncbi:hypothetical protein QBC35DRAFT_504025 [Podospora australis]|uniref:Uncharacterized protein n=1 Tax=Podospora australis TaxID=1536484 RepID=A0AAN6WNG8_9PEZI|nr:hypothetical protein QBC35DRAFT_504025 [Podospora australis]